MDPEQLRFIVLATASKALAEQVVRNQLTEQALRRKFGELAGQVAAVSTASEPARTTQVKTFAAIEIHDTIQCNEPLDAVKCLPAQLIFQWFYFLSLGIGLVIHYLH